MDYINTEHQVSQTISHAWKKLLPAVNGQSDFNIFHRFLLWKNQEIE
jgi:hypothetical protein